MFTNQPPKKVALIITVLFHLPLLLFVIERPTYPELQSIPPLEIRFGLEKALEVALFQPPVWELKCVDLPPFLVKNSPPPFFYSSRVLVDLKEGILLWSKPEPLLQDYLETLRFTPVEGKERYQWGYLTNAPKVFKEGAE